MKVIVAGGRDFKPADEDAIALESLLKKIGCTEVVSGTATGADAFGEQTARKLNLPVKRVPPDWKTHGKAAGPIRNKIMAEYADACVLFPGGRGTESMRQLAKAAGLTIYCRDNRGQE